MTARRGATDDCHADRLPSHGRLIALSVGAAVVETGVLLAVGPSDSAALGPQVSAPPPWGVFHDVRWLLVFHAGWATAIAAVLASVIVRGLLTAAAVRLAWPDRADVPSWPVAFRRAAAFTAGAGLVVLPWAALLFGVGVAPVSWVWFAGVAPAIAMGMVVHRGAIAHEWWDRPSLRTALLGFEAFAVLSAGGAAVALAPWWPLALLAAGLTGLWNAWAWQRLVHTVVCAERDRRSHRLGPALVIVIVAMMLGTAAIAFDFVLSRTPAPTPAPAVSESGRPVLVAGGFGTSFDGRGDDLLPEPYLDVRFSYRGLGADGRPLPYGAQDTYAPIPVLARRMAEQVAALHERTGQPVDIVAESEGTLVAQFYALGAVDPPVGDVVLLSPLLRPARVHFPPLGEDGWGVAGGYSLRAMTTLIGVISPFGDPTDTPFIRSLVELAPVTRTFMSCAAGGIEQTAVVALSDTVAQPMHVASAYPVRVAAAFHAAFLSGDVEVVTALLAGEPAPTSPVSAPVHTTVRALAQAWHVPRLPLELAWRGEPDGCAAIERILERRLATS